MTDDPAPEVHPGLHLSTIHILRERDPGRAEVYADAIVLHVARGAGEAAGTELRAALDRLVDQPLEVTIGEVQALATALEGVEVAAAIRTPTYRGVAEGDVLNIDRELHPAGWSGDALYYAIVVREGDPGGGDDVKPRALGRLVDVASSAEVRGAVLRFVVRAIESPAQWVDLAINLAGRLADRIGRDDLMGIVAGVLNHYPGGIFEHTIMTPPGVRKWAVPRVFVTGHSAATALSEDAAGHFARRVEQAHRAVDHHGPVALTSRLTPGRPGLLNADPKGLASS